MDVLSNAIKFFVKGVLDEASKRVAKRFDVPLDEAMDIWKDLHIDLDSIPSVKSIDSDVKTKKIVKKSKVSKSSSDEDEEDDKPDGCAHILTRGPKEGDSCGKKISAKSQTGHYCSVHLNRENKVKPVKKKEVKKEEEDRVNIKIRLDSNYGRYVQTGTGLVFKSAQEKIVIGVQDEHGDLLKLKPADIDMCKKYRFIYDEGCVEKPIKTFRNEIEIESSDESESVDTDDECIEIAD